MPVTHADRNLLRHADPAYPSESGGTGPSHDRCNWSDTPSAARGEGPELKVEAALKVTGQRGIQIWVPIRPGYTFADTRAWVQQVSRAVGRTLPDLVSWEWEKDRRGGLARLDYTQNAIHKTLVAPFNPRPSSRAPGAGGAWSPPSSPASRLPWWL
jgi:hypothetical protein